MPRCDGVEATRTIKAEFPDSKIVMLTVAASDETLFESLKAGASGYLLKSLNSTQFWSLLGEVMRGEIVLSPTLAASMLRAFAADDPGGRAEESAEGLPRLRPREQEVLALLVQGYSNREIAEALVISENTVKYHVGQILERLQLRNRHELAHYAAARWMEGSVSAEER
jgi:DNA-binding NarL/FixJ family response regulator